MPQKKQSTASHPAKKTDSSKQQPGPAMQTSLDQYNAQKNSISIQPGALEESSTDLPLIGKDLIEQKIWDQKMRDMSQPMKLRLEWFITDSPMTPVSNTAVKKDSVRRK